MFGFLMQCWWSYSHRNDRYVFGQGDMTCLRSSKIPLIPSKTKYPLGKHPNNLMPKKTSPRASDRSPMYVFNCCVGTIAYASLCLHFTFESACYRYLLVTFLSLSGWVCWLYQLHVQSSIFIRRISPYLHGNFSLRFHRVNASPVVRVENASFCGQ